MDRLSKLRRDLVKEFKVDMNQLSRNHAKQERDHALIDACIGMMKNSLQQFDNRATLRSHSVRNLHSESLESTFLRQTKGDKPLATNRDVKLTELFTERSLYVDDETSKIHRETPVIYKTVLDLSNHNARDRRRQFIRPYSRKRLEESVESKLKNADYQVDSLHNLSTQQTTGVDVSRVIRGKSAIRQERCLERKQNTKNGRNVSKDSIYKPVKRPGSVPRSYTRCDPYKPIVTSRSKLTVSRYVKLAILKAFQKLKIYEDRTQLRSAFTSWKVSPLSLHNSRSNISFKRVPSHRIPPKQLKKKTDTQVQTEIMFELVKKNDIRGIKSISHKFSVIILNSKDSHHNTAIYYSALAGNILLLSHLWSLGAKLNIRCENNNTEMHAAFQSGSIEIVLFLLQKGSELDVYNDENMTPLDYSNEKILNILGISSPEMIGKVIPKDIAISKLSCGKVQRTKRHTVIEIKESREPSPTIKPAITVLKSILDYSPLYGPNSKSGLIFKGQRNPSFSLETSLIKYNSELENALKPESKLFKHIDIKKAGNKEYLAILSLEDEIDIHTLKAHLSDLTYHKA